MLVMKFGGTSVANAERMRVVCALVAERRHRDPVVVVSAMAGVTDQLIEGVGFALERDGEARNRLVAELGERHLRTLTELALEPAEHERVAAEIETILDNLDRIYYGISILGEATARSRDAVLERGERLSSQILAAALTRMGTAATWVDARQVMRTNAQHGQAAPDRTELKSLASKHVCAIVAEGRVPVIAGFVGATKDGVPTTLGRGGSDFSAALFGVAVGAEEVQIWTDVDGMMTADPRIAPRARVIARVPFDEAAELAYFGAKVLHPATLRPAIEGGIPVRIKNTLRPQAKGTEITAPHGDKDGITAVATKKGISLVTISSPRMLGAHGVLARIFSLFDQRKTPVDLVATSEVSVSLTVDDVSELEAIREDLTQNFQVRQVDGCAIVSVVGRGILTQHGIAARVFHAVRDLNVLMISVGASDINVSFVVRENDAARAVTALHAEFFETDDVAEGE